MTSLLFGELARPTKIRHSSEKFWARSFPVFLIISYVIRNLVILLIMIDDECHGERFDNQTPTTLN